MLISIRTALLFAFFSAALASSSVADLVTDWNEAALQAIRSEKTPPPNAARALAILHASIFDAINGITQTHERYLVTGKPPGAASPEAAASAAAHLALIRLFPAQQTAFDATYQRALGELPNGPEKNTGIHWGEWVANLILVARSTDGAGENAAHAQPSGSPGLWTPTPPLRAPALLPHWASVTCFTMTSGAQFRPVQPPALTSAMYAFDFNLTKQLGAKESTARTAEQSAIAQFWADGPGTVTPPGHWNLIARDIAAQRGTAWMENARLFALLNLALADAAICCWDCKFTVNLWRPITAIHQADTDRNPATEQDAAWTPLLATPPFPEYTSGHSTFSSAAATVLAAFFGSDNIPFSSTSDGLPGFSRSYQAFSEAAAEAGMSRIYGGIHFMSANQQGLLSGARLGAYVTENFLKAKPRPAPLSITPTTAPANVAPSVPSAQPFAATPPPSTTPASPAMTAVSPAQEAVPAAPPARSEPIARPLIPSTTTPVPTLPSFPAAIPAADLDRSFAADNAAPRQSPARQ